MKLSSERQQTDVMAELVRSVESLDCQHHTHSLLHLYTLLRITTQRPFLRFVMTVLELLLDTRLQSVQLLLKKTV